MKDESNTATTRVLPRILEFVRSIFSTQYTTRIVDKTCARMSQNKSTQEVLSVSYKAVRGSGSASSQQDKPS
jgi:hypothetical protein